jgi:hypothetical protein
LANRPFCKCPPELLQKYRLACGDIVFARIGATTGKSYLVLTEKVRLERAFATVMAELDDSNGNNV